MHRRIWDGHVAFAVQAPVAGAAAFIASLLTALQLAELTGKTVARMEIFSPVQPVQYFHAKPGFSMPLASQWPPVAPAGGTVPAISANAAAMTILGGQKPNERFDAVNPHQSVAIQSASAAVVRNVVVVLYYFDNNAI